MSSSSFWSSGTGKKITGSADEAFIQDFATIPEGTAAIAEIFKFELGEHREDRGAYKITWRILEGEFKGRRVTQSIRCFAPKPEQVDRALNMLKLVMDLCEYVPSHGEAPSTDDVSEMCGAVLGIKIGEWEQGGKTGNFVREVHPSAGFEVKTGEAVAAVTKTPESALTRNAAKKALSEQDVPW